MRWLFAGLTFAAAVGLAVATAAMRADSLATRARLQLLVERIDAAEVRLAAERAKSRAASTAEVLCARWRELAVTRFDLPLEAERP